MAEAQYPEIERLLADSRALTDVPEAHGTLAGALCAAADYRFEDWLREIYAEGKAPDDARDPLEAVFEDTRRALAAGQMQFDVMLPGDDVPISDRATALGQWCQGFLYGLGTNPIPDVDALPEEVSEIVREQVTVVKKVNGTEAKKAARMNPAYAAVIEKHSTVVEKTPTVTVT